MTIRNALVLLFSLALSYTVHAELTTTSPSAACSALEQVGLVTRGWKDRGGADYGCTTPYKDIGTGYPLANNLAYYAEGTQSTVRLTKLVLNVNQPAYAKSGHAELVRAADVLAKSVSGEPLSKSLRDALIDGKRSKGKLGKTGVTVIRDDWPTGRGYEVKVVFE